MQALNGKEFLRAEGLEDGCRSCGGRLEEAERKNTMDGTELPRYYCRSCGEIFEQTDDYAVDGETGAEA
mgnify:CR=1 FL=1